MKIELTQYHEGKEETHIILNSNQEDEDIFAVCQLFKQALVGIGYHPDSVKEAFNEEEE